MQWIKERMNMIGSSPCPSNDRQPAAILADLVRGKQIDGCRSASITLPITKLNRTRAIMITKHAPLTACGLIATTLLLNGCSNEPATDAAMDALQATGANLPAIATSITSLVENLGLDPATTKFQDLAGHGFEIDDLQGRKVFLNYWATWCAPCIREIPAISRAAAELEDENYLFLLASDESTDVISNFVDDRQFSGNFIKLNGFFGGHGIDAVPSSILYDENGAVLNSWAGAFEWDSQEMLAALRGE
jgi:thiol-disulfide isomerase/thioredoxin